MKNLKKLICVLLSSVLILSAMSLSCLAASPKLVFEIRPDETAVLTGCSVAAEGKVTIPDKYTYKGKSYPVSAVADNAFEGCHLITELTFGEGVETIGARAFKDCTALTDVYFPSTLITCDISAFNNCGSITLHCYGEAVGAVTPFLMSSEFTLDVVDGEREGSSPIMNIIINMIRTIFIRIFAIFFPDIVL